MKTPLLGCVGLAVFLAAGFSAAVKAGEENPSARIDALMAQFWKEKGVTPRPIADDATFVRRIYLDVAGRIPTAEEARGFLEDPAENKRTALIDELLGSEGYVNHYFNWWADLLRINSNLGGGQNIGPAYIEWVKSALRDNKPYDEIVRELVDADGGSYETGSTGYYYRDRGMPLDNMANTVRIFLGTRLECAQCHNHPFDKWTQMDFYHMAAFSYGVNVRNQSNKFSELQREVLSDRDLSREEKSDLRRAFQEIGRPLRNRPEVAYEPERLPQLPHDYKYDDAAPKQKIDAFTMFGANPEIASPGARMEAYTAWMTSPENPRFTKVIANRLWKRAMGLGLVEPVDEWMDSTEAVYPQMLDFLESQMVSMDYDMKAFLRMLFNTQLYQRESVADDLEDPAAFAFTGPQLRRMSAEQIWDSVVALINPKPDEINWKQQKEIELREAGMDMMTEALNSKTPEALLADAKRIAARQKGLQEELAQLQKEQVKARQAKDQKKARELAREAGQIRNQLRDQIYDSIYAPAMKEAKIEVVSLDLPEGLGTMEMKPGMLDDNGRPNRELRRQLDEMEAKLIDTEMDEVGVTDPKERRGYANFRRGTISNFARAANLRSPAPAGHFLQQFGQSDRETIENAETAASVPQALTLLNGPLFNSINGSYTVYSRTVDAQDSPDAKVDAIFLSFLGRLPDDEERAMLGGELQARGDQFYRDLGYALMNSPEFLFVR
ncbi:MAG: DUF1549 domain-containing protein [Verrucomicrobiae bacterium]|nr:DUF1549 domain-containing protein [Verrucomicrobiae bacterium]